MAPCFSPQISTEYKDFTRYSNFQRNMISKDTRIDTRIHTNVYEKLWIGLQFISQDYRLTGVPEEELVPQKDTFIIHIH